MRSCVTRSQPIVRVGLDRTGPLVSLPQIGTLTFPGQVEVEVRSSEPILTSLYEVRDPGGVATRAQAVRTSLYTDRVEVSALTLPGGVSTLVAAITDMVGNLTVATTRIDVIRLESHRLVLSSSQALPVTARTASLHEMSLSASGAGPALVLRQASAAVIEQSVDPVLKIETRTEDAAQ